MNLKELEPELRDEVKSKIVPDMTGIVIAKYPGGENQGSLIVVRLFNEKNLLWLPGKKLGSGHIK